MITRAKKEEMLKALQEKLQRSEAVFIASFRGFKVSEVNEIRRLIREKGGEYRVYKNTLIRIGSENTPFRAIMDYVEGPTALVFSYKDPVEIAKVLKEFIKTHPNLQLRGLVIKGKGYDSQVIDELVKLPPKEILLAQLLGTIQAPLSGFVGVLSAVIRNFLYVLKAIEEKKGKGES
ncbi:MAG: 50S ribosomal protein L10 [Caldimicrobium sp.]|nr:50S ribosomal protein L10 [Caldimicrobium sp.]MCX7873079.1 50S ribosomal protein L10 [Caldimicrobium sp.]MDW8094504.1 50S ribosomal protein L10 [Caldimicrobium sp.]